jgi:hypothetical protein
MPKCRKRWVRSCRLTIKALGTYPIRKAMYNLNILAAKSRNTWTAASVKRKLYKEHTVPVLLKLRGWQNVGIRLIEYLEALTTMF